MRVRFFQNSSEMQYMAFLSVVSHNAVYRYACTAIYEDVPPRIVKGVRELEREI
jgi:hypothetical protein